MAKKTKRTMVRLLPFGNKYSSFHLNYMEERFKRGRERENKMPVPTIISVSTINEAKYTEEEEKDQ